MPSVSIDEMVSGVRIESMNPSSNETIENLVDTYKSLKAEMAEHLGVDQNNLAYIQSTNAGIINILNSLKWKENDIVILNRDEYIDGILPVWALSKKYKVKIEVIDDMSALEDYTLESAGGCVKAVFFSHLECNTGKMNDIEKISKIAKSKFPEAFIIVDGAQALGQMKIVGAKMCDCYIFPFHKWMLGPSGTGMMYINDPSDHRLESINVSALGAILDDAEGIKFQDSARRFENSSFNFWLFRGALSSLRYMNQYGLDNVYKKQRELSQRFMESIDLEICSKSNIEMSKSCGMVFANMPDQVLGKKFKEILEQKNMICRTFDHDLTLRFCFHIYNSNENVDRLASEFMNAIEVYTELS